MSTRSGKARGLRWGGVLLAAAVVVGGIAYADAVSWVWAASPRQAAAMPDAGGIAKAAAPGPVSVGFAQDMALHHEQALQLARMAEAQASAPLQAWARGLAQAQLKEVGYLQGWLVLWGEPAIAPVTDMGWMAQAYGRSGQRSADYERFISRCNALGGMPGLVSAQEFERLAGLQGAAFDRLFLRLMIRHHESALVMAQFAHEHAEHEAVRQLAAAMASEQRGEWLLMARLLHQSG